MLTANQSVSTGPFLIMTTLCCWAAAKAWRHARWLGGKQSQWVTTAWAQLPVFPEYSSVHSQCKWATCQVAIWLTALAVMPSLACSAAVPYSALRFKFETLVHLSGSKKVKESVQLSHSDPRSVWLSWPCQSHVLGADGFVEWSVSSHWVI